MDLMVAIKDFAVIRAATFYSSTDSAFVNFYNGRIKNPEGS
jgi:hypothetical protein